MYAGWHSRPRSLCHTPGSVCRVAQQRFLLCDTADIVCCLTQQTMSCCVAQQMLSAVSHSRQWLLVAQQTTSAVSHSGHCLLYHTAGIVCPGSQQALLLWDRQANSEAGTPSSRLPVCLPLLAEVLCVVQGCWDVSIWVVLITKIKGNYDGGVTWILSWHKVHALRHQEFYVLSQSPTPLGP